MDGGKATRAAASHARSKRPLAPVVVFIHGGGWQRGDRKYAFGLYGNVGRAFAASGFVSPVISYRLSHPLKRVHYSMFLLLATVAAVICHMVTPNCFWLMFGVAAMVFGLLMCLARKLHPFESVKFPVHIQDCAQALRWVHDNIERYGGDRTRVAVCGHSAGGHLAALLALDPQWCREAGVPSDFIKAVVGVSGVYAGAFRYKVVQGAFNKLFGQPVFAEGRTNAENFPLAHLPETPLSLRAELPPPGSARGRWASIKRRLSGSSKRGSARVARVAARVVAAAREARRRTQRTGSAALVPTLARSSSASHVDRTWSVNTTDGTLGGGSTSLRRSGSTGT